MGAYYAGIDLGTTFTAAAVARDGRLEMVLLGGAESVIPSLILLREDGSYTIGHVAEQQGAVQPGRLARHFKRRFGDTTPIFLGGAGLPAHLLYGHLLRAVVDQISRVEGGPPGRLAVTHPANWSAFKLDLLRQVIEHFDLGDVALVSEPGAAAIHYAAQARVEVGSIVAVYDLGGGTFDAAVLRKSDNGFELVGEPKGVEHLGGIDFDAAVYEHVRRHADGALDSVDEADVETADRIRRLKEDCIKAKHVLSAVPDATIPVLLRDVQRQVLLTRAEFEAAIRPTLERTIVALRQALASAGVAPADLSRVLLVGGSSRIPLVAQLVRSELGIDVAVDTDPKNAVAKGAALFAAQSGVVPAPRRGRDVEVALDVSFGEAFTGATKAVSWDDQARQVDVPAGVTHGEQLRLAGQGGRGTGGGPAGDLLVTVAVGDDPEFERDGADLLVRRPLTAEEAEEGTTLAVRTPEGEVEVPVPAGTRSGDLLRVPGAGFSQPGTDQRGDLVVTLGVAEPEPRDGADAEAALQLTFEEAYLGASRQVAVGDEARTVEIPAGIADGDRLPFPGRGHPGVAGGSPGDLYVAVDVAEHPEFGRDGTDLLASHAVPADVGESGATVHVAVPGGRVPVVVPPGTGSGDEVRAPGHGFPVPGTDRRGDLVVTLEVAAPETPVRGADVEAKADVSFEESYTGGRKTIVVGDQSRTIEIPAGVPDGERLRLDGQGGTGTAGGPAGDLIVEVAVADHTGYGRREDDLLVDHQISASAAEAGGQVNVRTPSGPVPVNVPPGTSDGAEVRVAGHGFPDRTSGHRGDLVVTLRVEEERSSRLKWLVGGGIAAAVITIVAIVALSNGDNGTADVTLPAAPAPTEAPEATEPESAGGGAVDLAGTSVSVFGVLVDEDALAVQAALDEFASESGIDIAYTGARDFSDQLPIRANEGNPPDIALFFSPRSLAEFARAGTLAPAPPEVVAAASSDWGVWMEPGVVDDAPFGIPVGGNQVKSLVWHKPGAFAANGYAVPETWQELLDLTDQMISDGFTPWCVGIESGPATGWVFTDWVEDVLLRFAGAEFYDRWAAHEVPFDRPEVEAAWNEVLELWNTPGAVHAPAGGAIAATGFGDLGGPLLDEECLMHRQAAFYVRFFPDGTTFGLDGDVSVFYLPSVGGERPIVGSGFYAGAFRDAPEVWAVVEFMAGARFAELTSGRFMSANATVSPGVYDPLEEELVAIMQSADVVRFDASDLMPAAVGAGTFWAEGTRAVNGEISVGEALASIEASFP